MRPNAVVYVLLGISLMGCTGTPSVIDFYIHPCEAPNTKVLYMRISKVEGYREEIHFPQVNHDRIVLSTVGEKCFMLSKQSGQLLAFNAQTGINKTANYIFVIPSPYRDNTGKVKFKFICRLGKGDFEGIESTDPPIGSYPSVKDILGRIK